MSNPKTVTEFLKKIGLSFKDTRVLELAMIHKSFGNEHRSQIRIDQRDNERLEFLGDAILDFIVSQALLENFPEATEGDLSKLRAGLVNERILAQIARDLDLGPYIWLGKGEELTGGREKDSILSSTLEAVVAAIYLDGGFAPADQWVRALFADKLSANSGVGALQDFKTRLQEVVQAKFKTAPRYEIVQSSGPDHDKTFEVRLLINGKVVAQALGKSKKEAEQNAAKLVFERYGADISI